MQQLQPHFHGRLLLDELGGSRVQVTHAVQKMIIMVIKVMIA